MSHIAKRLYVGVSLFKKRSCGCSVTMKSHVSDDLKHAQEQLKVHYDIYIQSSDIYARINQQIEVYDEKTNELLAVMSSVGGE